MKAECIRPDSLGQMLILGKVYDVAQNLHFRDEFLLIDESGIENNWKKDRFKLVVSSVQKMRAKCIDRGHNDLTNGKIYEVEQDKDHSDSYRLTNDSGDVGPYLKRRFRLLQDIAAKPIQSDVLDWKMFAHKRPGECPCGIPKSVCNYHS
jgi:hypothetical protein